MGFLFPPPQFLQGRRHVEHQLDLQAMVEAGQIQLLIAGLIIHYLDIDPLRRPHAVYPVNLAAKLQLLSFSQLKAHRRQLVPWTEGHLKFLRHKVTACHLLSQCPNAAAQDRFHPPDHLRLPPVL